MSSLGHNVKVDRMIEDGTTGRRWISEESLCEIPSTDRRVIERELYRCLSTLEALNPDREPLTIRLLLKDAIEQEIELAER